jgi:hypothetical protein
MENRPYKSPNDVPDAVPKKKKAQFMEVWNSAYAKAKKDGKSDDDAEKSAFAQAWGVIGKGEKIMQAKRELRFLSSVEIRTSEDGKTLSGYAAKFDNWTNIGNMFRECVRAGAFANAIKSGQDVRALFNHDMNCVLGRTVSGTLRLSEDEVGLAFEIDVPDTQLGHDIHCLVSRGDISGCSFGFIATGERWTEHKDAACERELLAVDLYDVSLATYPAYPDTSVDARKLWPDGAPEEIERHMNNEKSEELDDVERNLKALRLAAEIEFSKTR